MFIAAWAHKRGFLTAKAGRTDVYRAGRFRKSGKEKTVKFQFQALSEPSIFNRDAAKWREVRRGNRATDDHIVVLILK